MGAPVGIGLAAGIAVPAMIIGLHHARNIYSTLNIGLPFISKCTSGGCIFFAYIHIPVCV